MDVAWQARNFWQGGLANITGTIAFGLVLFTLQLAWGRRQEPVYALLCANALFWGVSGFQYTHDFTGQETLSLWYGWAVDASINWVVALNFLFAFELVGFAYPRLRVGLVVYAVTATLLTMPLGQWDSYALVAQHLLNLLVWIGGTLLLTWHAWRSPRRDLVLVSIGCWVQFVLGAHDVLYLTNQPNLPGPHSYLSSGADRHVHDFHVPDQPSVSAKCSTCGGKPASAGTQIAGAATSGGTAH